MLGSIMKIRIRNILQEVVQGDLFIDTFRKEDERIATLQSEIERRQVLIAKLGEEVRDWQNRQYKSNSRPVVDTNNQTVSVGQINERRRQNEISSRRQQIQRLKDEIIQLEVEMRK